MNKEQAQVNLKRWVAYAAAGMAATCAGSQSAEAEITHIIVGSPTGDWTLDNDIYFALEGNASLNFWHPGNRALLGIYNAANGVNGSVAGFVAGNYNYLSRLDAGDNISSLGFINGFADLASQSGFANSQFVNTSGYAAFRFDLGTGSQFGWVRLTSLGDAPINSFVVEEYAFADVGEGIVAGQISSIPEPTSLGLLALGAAGVITNRRRRKEAA